MSASLSNAIFAAVSFSSLAYGFFTFLNWMFKEEESKSVRAFVRHAHSRLKGLTWHSLAQSLISRFVSRASESFSGRRQLIRLVALLVVLNSFSLAFMWFAPDVDDRSLATTVRMLVSVLPESLGDKDLTGQRLVYYYLEDGSEEIKASISDALEEAREPRSIPVPEPYLAPARQVTAVNPSNTLREIIGMYWIYAIILCCGFDLLSMKVTYELLKHALSAKTNIAILSHVLLDIAALVAISVILLGTLNFTFFQSLVTLQGIAEYGVPRSFGDLRLNLNLIGVALLSAWWLLLVPETRWGLMALVATGALPTILYLLALALLVATKLMSTRGLAIVERILDRLSSHEKPVLEQLAKFFAVLTGLIGGIAGYLA